MGLAKRMAELSRDMTGIRRAIARDLRAGESFIVAFERKLKAGRVVGGLIHAKTYELYPEITSYQVSSDGRLIVAQSG